MSIKYDSQRQLLSDIIEKASRNATYLIPDLQRPYVWSPRQVILLVDSLFRGWPFGSLLLWEIQPECYQEGEGIPHRPFWQVVDRTDEKDSMVSPTMGQPATYYMVLDGQQRIQSLLLALGGDSWGFKLYNHDWSIDLHDRRMRKGRHWSMASLCVDLEAFEEEVERKKGKVRKIEVGEILRWAVTDRLKAGARNSVSGNYEHPVDATWEKAGKFVRLSRFWDLAQSELPENEYREMLEPFLAEQQLPAERIQELKQPLAEFMKTIESVKNNSYVHALKIESFRTTPQWTKDDYDSAIVNIFTRLNTAGRTLTREEITLAWLKVGWESVDTDNVSAGECLERLREELSDRNLVLTMDDMVRLISFIWAVEERDGALLEAKDLLKGNIIRPMAQYVSRHWKRISEQIRNGATTIQSRSLYENMGSTNAVIVFLGWIGLGDRWLVSHGWLRVPERDGFEKKIRKCIDAFLDRWIIASQWANVWSVNAVQNFREFAEILGNTHKALHAINDVASAVAELQEALNGLLRHIVEPATNYIEHLTVRERKKVYLYRSALWVWHRLDPERWTSSCVPMRIGRRGSSHIEVDHTVADAMWRRKAEAEIERKRSNAIAEAVPQEELGLIAPDGFETSEDSLAFVNTLGNCTLLEKSFNISKSDGQLRDFLDKVHDFTSGTIVINEWREAMDIPTQLLEPASVPLAELRMAIQGRDDRMRAELVEFVRGERQRKDCGDE